MRSSAVMLNHFVARHIMRFYRPVTIGSSVILGVASSSLTDDGGRLDAWCLLLGSMIGVYAGDVMSTVNAKSELLSRSSRKPQTSAGEDLFEAEVPSWFGLLLIGGILLIIMGFLGEHTIAIIVAFSDMGDWNPSSATPTISPT